MAYCFNSIYSLCSFFIYWYVFRASWGGTLGERMKAREKIKADELKFNSQTLQEFLVKTLLYAGARTGYSYS